MAILVKRFETWLAKAEHGDEHVYHYGRLDEDRREWNAESRTRVPNELDVLARTVRAAFDRGEVHLFQGPLDRGGSREYIARRRIVGSRIEPVSKAAMMAGSAYGYRNAVKVQA